MTWSSIRLLDTRYNYIITRVYVCIYTNVSFVNAIFFRVKYDIAIRRDNNENIDNQQKNIL